MRLGTLIVFASVLVGFATDCLRGDTVLFDDRIDSQQKTEIRYDVPDGCVITGLGFRAHYDNVTTMYVRHHRLTAESRLIEETDVWLGSEPNHACEARIDLPEGWVAVGFGAAGEPEWDVTLLRIWARKLQRDGTLGEMKTFNHGFKPEREPERDVLLSESDRVLTGAGLRFASNDIGGIYARSQRIVRLDDDVRRRMRSITTRAWSFDSSVLENMNGAVSNLKKYGVNRVDLDFRSRSLPSKAELSLLSKLQKAASGIEIHVSLRSISTVSILRLFNDASEIAGIVVDLPSLPSQQQVLDVIGNLQGVCAKADKKLSFRIGRDSDPHSLSMFKTVPRELGVVLPFEYLSAARKAHGRFDPALLDSHKLIVEVNPVRYSRGSRPLPDFRINEMPGLLLEMALAGADGFVVPVNIGRTYLPDSINAPVLAALHKLADDPMQSTDALWEEFCTARYGPAAEKAVAALKRTPAINDLIFKMLGREVLWDGRKVLSMDVADNRLAEYIDEISAIEAEAGNPWLASDSRKVKLAMQELDTAFWLLKQSVANADDAVKINPTAQTRGLLEAMNALNSAADFWLDAKQAFLQSSIYAIDGAPSTRALIDEAMGRLRNPKKDAVKFDGTEDFVRSVEKSVAKSAKDALLVRSLDGVRILAEEGKDDEAAAALLAVLNFEKYAPHLSKQNDAIADIASSLKAFGETSANIGVMRHGDGSWSIEKVGGRWSWAIGGGRPPCLYIDFPGGPLEAPADYILSFEYFDKGDWTLTFHYDSAYPPEQKSDYHPAEPLQLTNTETWKKGAFLLTNCRFASRENALADMRFVTGAGANIRNIRLARRPTGAIDSKKGKRLFYRILGSQSNGPYVRKTRTVAAPDYVPRTPTTGMANAGFTEYPFCYGNWSLTYREREGIFPRFAMSLPMDPTRVNTCDILADWVYEPDACVWGPACKEFGQTFVANNEELVSITLLVASPRAIFDLSVHENTPEGRQIAPTRSFTSGHSMEWATIRYPPGKAKFESGKTYYVKIVRQDGKAWNPFFHATGNVYDKGCAYLDGVRRLESDLGIWITTERSDVTRAVVLNVDKEGWTKPASGFEFVPRADNTRMITVQLRPVKEFCIYPVAYVYQLEPDKRLICGPKYSHSCARVNTTYEASFLYSPGEFPCEPGKKYYAEIFAVPFEEGKDPVIPHDHASLATYEIMPRVYGETSSEPAPIIYNLSANAGQKSAIDLKWRLSKPARVQIDILAPADIAKTVNVEAGRNEYCISGLRTGDDCDFRLTSSPLEGPAKSLLTRKTPIYRVRTAGGKAAVPLWPETPEFFVPLAPRPVAQASFDEPKADWEEISIPDGDFESFPDKWVEDKEGIGALSRGDDEIKPDSGRQMYGWTHKAGRERKDVFLENSIKQTIRTKPGHKYVLTVRAITAVTNGTRGDTRVRLAVDPTGGDELKGKNSSQWFWTDGKWITVSHEFTAESNNATIAIGFFRWRDIDRADAYIDNIRLYDLGVKP